MLDSDDELGRARGRVASHLTLEVIPQPADNQRIVLEPVIERSVHLIPNTPSPVSLWPDSRTETTSAGPSRSDNVVIGRARRFCLGRYE
jgi:hypothetical protein